MTDLYFIDVVGFWLGIFLTFCILSFLYKDNPFYKLAEHLFVGVSIGYVVVQQYYNTLSPKVVERLGDGQWLAVIPLALVIALFVKATSRRFAWVGRYPVAFVVAFFAGVQINGVAQAELGAQIKRAMADLDAEKVDVNTASEDSLRRLPGMTPSVARKVIAYRVGDRIETIDDLAAIPTLSDSERDLIDESRGRVHGLDAQAATTPGERYWFGILSNLLLLAGTLASLLYFYFSLAHKGVVGRISKFGVWVLMIGFGASFGYTVQGRIALAIGRAQDVMGTRMDPSDAAQVQGPWAALISVAIIVTGIAIWELRSRRRHGDGGGARPAGSQ
jgi:hypothetical protein